MIKYSLRSIAFEFGSNLSLSIDCQCQVKLFVRLKIFERNTKTLMFFCITEDKNLTVIYNYALQIITFTSNDVSTNFKVNTISKLYE